MEKITLSPYAVRPGLVRLGIFVRFLLSKRYKVQMEGTDLLSTETPKLFLPNHLALIDPVILVAWIYQYQPIYPFITEEYFSIPGVKGLFAALDARAVPNALHARKTPDYLDKLLAEILSVLGEGKNVLLYPSGQLTVDGKEHLKSQKIGWMLIKDLPADVRVIGVRTTGLWGSSFSKFKTGKTPPLIRVMLENILYALVHGIFFMPRKNVSVKFFDITDKMREMSSKDEFHKWLEQFYAGE